MGVQQGYGTVKEVQQKLIDSGYDPGPVDNLWGPRTEAAVRKFQQDKGLDVDAIVGPQTWGALNQPKPQPTPQAPQPAPTAPTTPLSPEDEVLKLIGSDPEGMALYNQAKQAAKLGSQNAMEELNSRGILNSTITADRVSQTEQQAMTGVLPSLLSIDKQNKQQKIADAYNKLNLIGYADNEIALTLGIPVGTPSSVVRQQQAQEAAQARSAAKSSAQAAAKPPTPAQLKEQATQWAYETLDQFAQDPNNDLEDILSFIRRNARDFYAKGVDVESMLKRAEVLYSDEFFGARTNSYIDENGEVPW